MAQVARVIRRRVSAEVLPGSAVCGDAGVVVLNAHCNVDCVSLAIVEAG